ncbi:MAG: DNA sulfur modification protein DndB [Algicola sp.]|nr:DNA sulfur modification protein DndB [Algicola sp.]
MNAIVSGTSFPAIRGTQAGKEYYTIMCPLKRLKKIFTFDESGLMPEDRAQRTLVPSRIPQIAGYINDNRDSYTFSSLTACIDGDCHFKPIGNAGHDQKIGTLTVDEDAEFYITDGQHRSAAINKALEEDPSLANETISVVFFINKTLKERQKVFRDLNLYPIKPSHSLSIRFGDTPPEKLTNAVADKSDFFNGVISFEDINLGTRSTKLFKNSSLYAANQKLMPKVTEENLESTIKLALEYWNTVAKNLTVWQLAKSNDIPPIERQEFVNFSAIVLKCFGMIGYELLNNHKNWKTILKKLQTIDWRRSNKQNWEGRCINQSRMDHSNYAATLTVNTIKKHLNLPLTEKEQTEENKLAEVKRGN